MSFEYLKYDPDWRRFIREYQEDLSAGRYEPSWLREASEAMKERARGEFDIFKETEYEEFWGQKQKLAYTALAGESVNIRLSELLREGVLKVGDELSFRRPYKRDSGSWLVEKEMKVFWLCSEWSHVLIPSQILAIKGVSMTLAVPPGRQRFASLKTPIEQAAAGVTNEVPAATPSHKSYKGSSRSEQKSVTVPAKGGRKTRSCSKAELLRSETLLKTEIDNAKDTADRIPKDAETLESESPLDRQNSPGASTSMLSPAPTESSAENAQSVKLEEDEQSTTLLQKNVAQTDPPASQQEPALILEVNSLNKLEAQITDMDGRMSSKDVTARSAWRVIRVKRNNQDLGSLFEMREEYFAWKDPEPVKAKSRKGRK